MKRILALIILFSCASGAESSLQTLIRLPAVRRGEWNTAYLEYLRIAKEADNPTVATMAIRMADRISPTLLASPSQGTEELGHLARANNRPSAVRLIAGRMHAQRLLLQKPSKTAIQRFAALGFVTHWSVSGVYGRYGHASFYDTFPLDQSEGMGPSSEDALAKTPWRKVPPLYAVPGVNPWIWTSRSSGVVYAETHFTADTEQTLTLRIHTANSFVCMLDGQVLHQQDPLRTPCNREVYVNIKGLKKGKHRLRFKLFSGYALRNLQVQLIDPATGETPAGISFPESPPFRNVRTAGFTAIEKQTDILFQALSQPKPYHAAAKALLCLHTGLQDQAVVAAREAVDHKPGDPWLRLILADAIQSAGHMSPNRRETAAEQACLQAIKNDDGFVPAHTVLAVLVSRRGQHQDALKHIRKALSENPKALRPLAERVELAIGQQWTYEMQAWAEELRQHHPQSTLALNLLARLSRSKTDNLRLAEIQSRLVKQQNFPYNHRLNLIQTLITLGRNEEAGKSLHALATQTLTLPEHIQCARLYRALGKNDTAIEQCRAALARNDRQPDVWRRLGDLYTSEGMTKKAERAYSESLILKPDQHNLRLLLSHDAGKSPFWEMHRRDGMKALEACEGRPFAGSTVRVIDQTILEVYPDGSFANYTHGLQKILSRSGINDASTVPLYGDMLEVRTILPDRSTLEPIRLPQGREFTMPGLKVGAAVEERYLQKSAAPFDQSLRFPKWYFRSPNLEEAFLLSEYIIRVPKDYPFVYAARNIDRRVRFTKKTEDDTIVYQWTAMNMPQAHHEEGSPAIDEVLPFVEIGGHRDWKDINRLLINAYSYRLRPTHSLRKAATDLLQGATGEREKVERLHRFACEAIEEINGSWPASQILEYHAGDRLILLMALLKIAGLDPRYAAVRPPDSILYEPNWQIPQIGHFPNRLLRVRLSDGTLLWLDTRYRGISCGQILEDIAGGTAFVVDDKGGAFDQIPPIDHHTVLHKEIRTITLQGDKEARIQGQHIIRGSAGLVLKQELLQPSDRFRREVLEDHLNKGLPGIAIHNCEYKDLARAGTPYHVRYSGTVAALLRRTPDSIVLPIGFSPLSLLPETTDDPLERKSAYHLSRHIVHEDTFTFIVEGEGQWQHPPRSLMLRTKFGTYSMQVRQEKGALTVHRRCYFAPQRISINDWAGFVKMVRQIEDREDQPLRMQRQAE